MCFKILNKMLEHKNKHERDHKISFKDEGHIYTYDNKENFTSVTTLIHNFFPKFDSDKIIDKMMKSKNWGNSKYYGMSKEEIKHLWNENGRKASEAGTLMHASFEDFFNGQLNDEPSTLEFKQFKAYWNKFQKVNPSWFPYRTEWIVYDEVKKIAGSIDMTFSNPQGELIIVDWKRSKNIQTSNHWQKGFGPFSHLDDCNYNHYTLQLNIYRHILENHYNKKVLAMYLVVCHPNQIHANVIQVHRKDQEILNLWKYLPL